MMGDKFGDGWWWVVIMMMGDDGWWLVMMGDDGWWWWWWWAMVMRVTNELNLHLPTLKQTNIIKVMRMDEHLNGSFRCFIAWNMLRTLSTSYFADSTAKYVCEIPMGDRYHCGICSNQIWGWSCKKDHLFMFIYIYIYICIHISPTDSKNSPAGTRLLQKKSILISPNQKISGQIIATSHDLTLKGS